MHVHTHITSEEFTRLAETRLAQNTSNYLEIVECVLQQFKCQYMLSYVNVSEYSLRLFNYFEPA